MKRLFSILLSLFTLFMTVGCDQTNTPITEREIVLQEESSQVTDIISSEEPSTPSSSSEDMGMKENMEKSKMLIAYFSWSGNTKQVAQEIQQQTGAELFELIPVEPYPDNYEEVGDRWHEEQESNARPELAVEVEDMDDYDIIFLGYPIWSGTLPSLNRTFLEQYDFSGKTIIPFCAHGGSRFGNSISVIEELASGATILDGYEISSSSAGNCADEVAEWLHTLPELTERIP